jgi:CRP/FNR family cyclic AMP-dependent transcriptional regulator
MARKTNIDPLLAGVPFFSACTPEELAKISQMSTAVEVKAGAVLTREGHLGQEFFVIIEGEVKVEKDGKTVATLGRGDFFGEASLLDGGPRTATVTAVTDLVVEAIDHREFVALLEDAPHFTRSILKGVATRLRTGLPDVR